MNVIVAGQLAVTANDACVLCGYWTCRRGGFDVEPLEFDSLAGQDALGDMVAELAATAETDVDVEDLAYFRSLLAAPVIDIRTARSLLAVAA
ncbi:hypothetical protein YW3DRAFT_02812 [Streptomyces sp. MnatMP-M77]|uniref:hypothetical protein n=1 Tax=Streptomyces TaxID=1883 RepID=UPI000804CC50|nr:hypothetical protein [Streptomyces sp. MnatMP-M77]MYT78619.1 hypothetical protein [Streptomyces sp. SID8364]SBV06807.1 hypothetical protein YW3DRAFT_02812 [Streptomyces sp. MnatMP-M77]